MPTEPYYRSMLSSINVCLAKGGDRLHNLESMVGTFTLERQQSYADETEKYTLVMLKDARAKYPEHTEALDAIRHTMIMYVKLVRAGLELAKSPTKK
jgi:hypothetical protein